jgi:hypothetical protein
VPDLPFQSIYAEHHVSVELSLPFAVHDLFRMLCRNFLDPSSSLQKSYPLRLGLTLGMQCVTTSRAAAVDVLKLRPASGPDVMSIRVVLRS